MERVECGIVESLGTLGRRRRGGPVSGRAGLWARSDGGEEIQSPAGPASEQTRVVGELLQPPAIRTGLWASSRLRVPETRGVGEDA